MPKRRKELTLGQRLRRGFEEIVAIEKGQKRPARTRTYAKDDARIVLVSETRDWEAAGVADLRKALGMSQTVFARALNVSPATVRSWEQGQRIPDGAAVRLLEVFRDHPAIATKLVQPKK